jgi:hypothetical protein
VNHNTLTYQQFLAAIDHTKNHFAMLRKKFPQMKAYLVLALRGEQANDLSNLVNILREFPSLISDGDTTADFRRHLKATKQQNGEANERAAWQKLFQQYAENSTYLGGAQFELRFHHLDYDLIRQLQQDDSVNQQLTPQTKASIRIVLWTVGELV